MVLMLELTFLYGGHGGSHENDDQKLWKENCDI